MIIRQQLALCALVFLTSCAGHSVGKATQQVLFVGNSVIYTNNLPAVFKRIADAQPSASPYDIDMFARGGASLTVLSRDSRVLGLLESGRYDIVVFQERGGDALCVLVSEDRRSPDCVALIESHVRLANLAREHGAKVLYLGTYQLAPGASTAIVRAERALAERMAAEYVEVSERLQRLRESESEFPWLYADRGHPGMSTTTLMAVLIYETLNKIDPIPVDLCIDVQMYTPRWKHDGVVRHVRIVSQVQAEPCLLSRSQMYTIIQGAAAAPSTHGDKSRF